MDGLLVHEWFAVSCALLLSGLAIIAWRTARPRRAGIRRTIRSVASLLIAACLVALGGGVMHAINVYNDRIRFPAPGVLVSVGGKKIHVYCIGTRGAATVVLIPGWGGPSVMYESVVRQLAARQRTCVYDRAGYAWSDAGPWPRTLDAQVDELRAALSAAREPPPYVLLAHSFGGFIARGFALQAPQEITGVVLAETSTEFEVYRMAAQGHTADVARQYRLFAVGSAFGLVEVMKATADPVGTMFDGAFRADREAIYSTYRAKQLVTQAGEFELFGDYADEVVGRTLGDMPIAILASQPKAPPVDSRVPAEHEEYVSNWLHDLEQQRLATLSSNSKYLPLQATHLILQEHPDAAQSAIDFVTARAAARHPSGAPP